MQTQNSPRVSTTTVLPTGIGEATDSYKPLLEAIAEAFDSNAIRWCILHNYEGFPGYNVGRDIDFLISPDQIDSAVRALCNLPMVQVTSLVRRTDSVHVFTSGVTGSGLDLHLMFALAWKGQPYLDAKSVLDRSRPYELWPRLMIADECDDALFSLLESFVWKGSIKKQYRDRISAIFESNRDAVIPRLAQYAGKQLASKIINLVASCRCKETVSLVPQFRVALFRRNLRHRGLAAILDYVRYHTRELLLRIDPESIFEVALLGVDGAGKTTLLRSLHSSMRGAVASVEPIRFRRHILYDRKGGDYAPRDGDNPHCCPTTNWMISSIKLLVWYAELLLARYFLPRQAATLRLYDRYYHDVFVDPLRYRLTLPRWVAALMSRLAPEPDLWVLLDAAPALASSRKQELLVDELRRGRDAYLSFLKRKNNAIIVDASQTPEVIHADVRQAVTDLLAVRTRRRAGLPSPESTHPTISRQNA